MTDTVIFDFDDTLVHTNDVYESVRKIFYEQMIKHGCSYPQKMVYDYLNEADIANVNATGHLAKECFPRAMRQTYEYFCRLDGKKADEKIGVMLEKIGWSVYDIKPQWVSDARETLTALQGKVKLILFTQGDTDIQKKRLDNQGVLQFFEGYRITPVKNTDAYRNLLKDFQINAADSWMVGNSIRADVNPAIKAGLQAAHYQMAGWEFEIAEPCGEYRIIHKLTEVLELIK